MKQWGVAEWYRLLVERGRHLQMTGDWLLYQTSPTTVELFEPDKGMMCRAEIQPDGLCRVNIPDAILPPDVVEQLRCLLNLVDV